MITVELFLDGLTVRNLCISRNKKAIRIYIPFEMTLGLAARNEIDDDGGDETQSWKTCKTAR